MKVCVLAFPTAPDLFYSSEFSNYNGRHIPQMYCIMSTATIYLFYNYFNYLPGENIYEIPENELSFQQSLKLLTDFSQ